MQDRIPTPGQEGRVLVTPEDGSAPFYARISLADNPTQPGTPLDAATLLKNATAALYGFSTPEEQAGATPDDVFSALKLLLDSATALAAAKLKVESSTYSGTGVSGSLANATKINVPSWALFVFVVGGPLGSGSRANAWGNAFFVLPSGPTTGGYLGVGGAYSPNTYEGKWTGTQLQFYSNDPNTAEFEQMNQAGCPYTCYFIGIEDDS